MHEKKQVSAEEKVLPSGQDTGRLTTQAVICISKVLRLQTIKYT